MAYVSIAKGVGPKCTHRPKSLELALAFLFGLPAVEGHFREVRRPQVRSPVMLVDRKTNWSSHIMEVGDIID